MAFGTPARPSRCSSATTASPPPADQALDLQRDALERAGCDRVFDDTATGVRTDRAGLAEALGFACEGDILVVWRLDRLGRSLADIIAPVETLRARGVGF